MLLPVDTMTSQPWALQAWSPVLPLAVSCPRSLAHGHPGAVTVFSTEGSVKKLLTGIVPFFTSLHRFS